MRSLKYKALLLDVDGTLIPYTRNAVPSPRVTEAINRASKVVHIGIATSRCFNVANHIVDHLQLSGPSIFNGGAQIINFPSKQSLFYQTVDSSDARGVAKIFKKYTSSFILCDGVKEDRVYESKKNEVLINKICMMFTTGLESKHSQKLTNELSAIPSISIFTAQSWQSGKIDVLVTHAKATKQHGILEVAKILGISTHEIIAVGDSQNDFPLLMACGLKVAMGNAVEDLKAIADYVAPTVENDGVADVIEKFILNI